MSSLFEAVQKAGMAINSEGRRFPHQSRIRKVALQAATDRLVQAIAKCRACHTFHDLFEIVESAAGSVKGIGELYIYDTAIRIGAHRRLSPEDVYLHAGTRVGAKRLGLNVRRASISVAEFPREFQQLAAREIEDVLCIYKARFT